MRLRTPTGEWTENDQKAQIIVTVGQQKCGRTEHTGNLDNKLYLLEIFIGLSQWKASICPIIQNVL